MAMAKLQPTIGRIDRSGVLYDANTIASVNLELFDVNHWRREDRLLGSETGRGETWVLAASESERWILRHYRRGGMAAWLSRDLYLFRGLERSRPFREWRLIANLYELGLPVPRPVAAAYHRRGLSYRGDLITVLLPEVEPLAEVLEQRHLEEPAWEAIGQTLARFHEAGVDHTDLNAHNILLGRQGGVWLVDFDKCSRRAPGAWQKSNLSRLERSLRKLATERGSAFPAVGWKALNGGYGSATQ